MRVKRVAPFAAVALLLVAAVLFSALRDRDRTDVVAASGTIEATEADLGFQAGGRILAILAEEGDVVVAGAELARLDLQELEARRQSADAQVESAAALLAELRAGARPQELEQAAASERAARERLEEASRVLARTESLHGAGAVSRETLDQARTAHEVARTQQVQAEQQLSLVRTGVRSERVRAQQAVLRQAEAVRAQVEAALSYAVIRAPFDGVVTVRHREPGEAVMPGAPVLTVMNPASRWVRIFVREDEVGRVRPGQPARIVSDSHPDSVFPGRVLSVAREAEFTPRNVQTTEERVKLVYAVRVAITGDPGGALKPGVPADVTLVEQ